MMGKGKRRFVQLCLPLRPAISDQDAGHVIAAVAASPGVSRRPEVACASGIQLGYRCSRHASSYSGGGGKYRWPMAICRIARKVRTMIAMS